MTPAAVAGLADALIELFGPIVRAVEDPAAARALLRELGYEIPVPGASFEEFALLLEAFLEIFDETYDQARSDGEVDHLALFVRLIDGARELDSAIGGIGARLEAALTPEIMAATRLAERLPRQLADYLLVRMAERKFPVMHAALCLLGVIDEREVEAAPGPFHAPFTRRVIHWDRLGGYVDGAMPLVRQYYDWGTQNFGYELLISNVHRLALSLGAFASFGTPDPARLSLLHHGADVVTDDNADELWTINVPLLPEADSPAGFEIYPVLDAAGRYAGLGAFVGFDPARGLSFPITDDVTLNIAGADSTNLTAGLLAFPGRSFEPIGAGASERLTEFVPEFRFAPADESVVLLDTGGARFAFASFSVKAGLHEGLGGAFVEVTLDRCALTLSSDGADNFLKTILPAKPLSATFDLRVGFSTLHGLTFGGNIGLAVRLPTVATLGPVSLLATNISLRAASGGIALSFGADVRGGFGPLKIIVVDIGTSLVLKPPPGPTVKPGLHDFSIRFKPPSGLAILVSGGVATGGGSLYHDPVEELYSGAFELSFRTISVKAIVMLRTKVEGAPFALLAMVYARWPGGLELGLRFTLNAVGGMIGINHRFDHQALLDALPSGALDDILFPENPVADSRRILAALTSICPVEPKAYTLALMAELGWGSDYICALRIGVVLPLDDLRHIYLVGQVRIQCFQHMPEATRLRLICDAVGEIGFDPFSLRIDGRLRDSRFGPIGIEGQLVLMLSTGPNPRFLIAAGGFHPNFKSVPAGLPGRIDRLSVSYEVGRFKAWLKGYFALAAGTLQFGAEVGCRYKEGSLAFTGNLAIDALIHLNPFQFEAEVHFNVSVEYRDHELFGVHVKATLWGPDHWRIKGHGSFSILFWDVDVDFDENWGDDVMPPSEPIVLLDKATEDLQNDTYWQFDAPAAAGAVHLATSAQGAGDAVHPLATLAYRQRRFPLGMALDRVGGSPISGPQSVPIPRFFAVDGSDIAGEPALEPFAAGEYVDLADSARLTRPSFEPMPAGVVAGIAGYQLPAGTVVEAAVDYEEFFLPRRTRFGHELHLADLHVGLIRNLIQHEAAGTSAVGPKGMHARPQEPVRVQSPAWVAAEIDTLRPLPSNAPRWATGAPSALAQARQTAASVLVEAFELAV